MDQQKRKKLESGGWRIGGAEKFLGLEPAEAALVELRLALSEELREQRTRRGWTQVQLARKIGSSQSRVAKMEASDPGVSIDLLLRGLLASGASKKEIAQAINDSV